MSKSDNAPAASELPVEPELGTESGDGTDDSSSDSNSDRTSDGNSKKRVKKKKVKSDKRSATSQDESDADDESESGSDGSSSVSSNQSGKSSDSGASFKTSNASLNPESIALSNVPMTPVPVTPIPVTPVPVPQPQCVKVDTPSMIANDGGLMDPNVTPIPAPASPILTTPARSFVLPGTPFFLKPNPAVVLPAQPEVAPVESPSVHNNTPKVPVKVKLFNIPLVEEPMPVVPVEMSNAVAAPIQAAQLEVALFQAASNMQSTSGVKPSKTKKPAKSPAKSASNRNDKEARYERKVAKLERALKKAEKGKVESGKSTVKRKGGKKPKEPKQAKKKKSRSRPTASSSSDDDTSSDSSSSSAPSSDAPAPSNRIARVPQGRQLQQLAMTRTKELGVLRNNDLRAKQISDALLIIDTVKFNVSPELAYPDFHRVTGTGLPHMEKHIRDFNERYGNLIRAVAKFHLLKLQKQLNDYKILVEPQRANPSNPIWQFHNDLARAPDISVPVQIPIPAPKVELVAVDQPRKESGGRSKRSKTAKASGKKSKRDKVKESSRKRTASSRSKSSKRKSKKPKSSKKKRSRMDSSSEVQSF